MPASDLPSAVNLSSRTILARSDLSMRLGSPARRIECADFEDVRLALPASAVLNSRDSATCYSPEPPSPVEEFALEHQQPGTKHKYRQSVTHAFLDKCKLPPLITRAKNASSPDPYTPPSSLPPSEASSPTKSLASFITSNSNITNTASTASTRAKTASKNLFDNLFTGTSAPINLGVLPTSPTRPIPADEEQYPDGYEMEGPFIRSSTRSALTTRPRRTSTTQSSSSNTYSSKLGSWFSGGRATTTTPKTPPAGIAPEDPLLNLNISTALFPHGPADPLDPTSFHDLLTAAESVIGSFQSSYKARFTEIRDVRAEAAAQKEEVEEAETRAQHLKMQLDGMAAQLAVQQKKSDMLERMLEEERFRRRQSEEICHSRRTSVRLVRDDGTNESWKRNTGSDSGFESDGDSVFSANSPTIGSVGSAGTEIESGKHAQQVKLVRVQGSRELDSVAGSAFGNAGLRRENQQLRIRVAELEGAVEGCLEMVAAGVWK